MNEIITEQKKTHVKCGCLENLLKNKVTPALFLGSGFSKRYIVNYPDWWNLLKMLADKIGIPSFRITSIFDRDIAEGKTKSAAYLHVTDFLNEELTNRIILGTDHDILTDVDKTIISENHINPLKYLVSQIFTSKYDLISESYLIREIERFSNLKNNIPCIFTTNYDTFIESIFTNYKCFTNQQDYFYNDNTDFMEIYKLHGTASNPNSLVLTKDDYDKFDEQCYLSIAKLITILSERPIIFIGYSLTDPNISNIINKIVSCLDEQKLEKLEKNFIIIDRQKGKRPMQCGQKIYTFPNNTKGFRATYISTDNFLQLYWYLNQFKPVARPSELRKYKLQIKKLIETNDPELTTYVKNADSLPTLSETVAITELGKSYTGYDKMPVDELLIDALYKSNKHTPEIIIDRWFMERIGSNTNAPLYYYINRFNINAIPDRQHDIEAIKSKLNDFHNRKVKIFDTLFNKTESCSSIQQLDKLLAKKPVKASDDVKKILTLAKAYYIDNRITVEEYRKKLIALYESDNNLLIMQEMKKAIILLDYNPKLRI